MSIFVSFHSLYLKSILSDMSIATPAFFGLYLHGISFSSPSISVCKCPLFWGGSVVDNTYRGLVFVSNQSVFVFGRGIQPIYI